MNRLAMWLWLAFLFSVPLWMTDQYYLHILITAGIFIIAAMSLNLLLGYTGQLSLGHVAFFGIGGYTSALVSLGFDLELTDSYTFVFPAQPVWIAFLAGIVVAGFFGWLIGKISFKVRGAYFIIVTISFAEVVRLVALNWIDLTEGPMVLNNIPPLTLGIPGLWELTFWRKIPNYYLVLVTCILSYVVIARLVGSRLGRAMIALRENEPLAASVGVDVTRSLVLAAVISAAMAGAAGGLYTHLHSNHRPGRVPVHLHRDHGHHGGHRRQGHARRADRRRSDLRHPARGAARGRQPRDAVGDLRRVHDHDRVFPARWHRAGAFVLVEGSVRGGWWHGRRGAAEDRRGAGMSATPSNGNVVLDVDRLEISFGGLVALASVSFDVREGEIASLIGPNGAGKTTAFNAITGFLTASDDSIRYRGKTLNGLRPNQIADLGVVRTFQKTSGFAANTVTDNVMIGLHRYAGARLWEILLALPRVRDEESPLHAQAGVILELMGLAAHAEELGGALPYGEQRLLEVAVALAAQPSLLLLDEPVSGMNPSETAGFMAMLGRIRAGGITILLVEHDMRMVMGVSDRVIVLNQGAIIAEGAPGEIQRNPEVIRAYLGQGASKREAGRA